MTAVDPRERGFALVESLATLAFAIVAVSSGLTITYVSFGRVWLKRAAYETSICLSTRETIFNCEQVLRKTTRQALPMGDLRDIQLTRYRSEVQTRFRWQFATFTLPIQDIRPLRLLGPRPEGRLK